MVTRSLVHGRLLVLAVVAFGLGACDPAPRTDPAPVSTSVAAPAARVIEIEASDRGFVPSTVEAAPGETVTLRFKRTTGSGCLASVAFPDLGVSKDLPQGTPVDIPVTIPADGSKVLFQCGMGMIRGRVVAKS